MQLFMFVLAVAAALVALNVGSAAGQVSSSPSWQSTVRPPLFNPLGVLLAAGGTGAGGGGATPEESIISGPGFVSSSTTAATPVAIVNGQLLEFGASGPALESASDIMPCNVNDPGKNECIKTLFQTLLPKLKDGLPAYNMGSIDPYYYRRGIFRYANDGIQGGLLIKNMYIHGLSTLRIHSVLSNFTDDAFIIKLSAELPKLQAVGEFKADVKFGGLRLVPKGPFNITIDNVKATMLTDGVVLTTASGERRVQLRRLNANVAVGNARIVANGIFSDRNLNMMILNLVNENLPEITRVGIPATREQWAPILVEHINEFFASVPIEKLLY